MAWNTIPLNEVGIDTGHIYDINDRVRLNMEEVMKTLSIHEAGEKSQNGGTLYYDLLADSGNLLNGANQQIYYRWQMFIPGGIKRVNVIVSLQSDLSHPNLYAYITLGRISTAVPYSNSIPNILAGSFNYYNVLIPPPPGVFIHSPYGELYTIEVVAYNLSGSNNKSIQMDEMVIFPVLV